MRPFTFLIAGSILIAASGCCRVGSHTCCTGANLGFGDSPKETVVIREPAPATAPAEQGDIVRASGVGGSRREATELALEDALLRRDRLGFAGHRLRLLDESVTSRMEQVTNHTDYSRSTGPAERFYCQASYRILPESISSSASAQR